MDNNVNITVIVRHNVSHHYQIPDDIGISLMELCKANDLPVLATCGGMALCATCHVFVESDHDFGMMGEDEELMLDQVPNYKKNSRLACQIRVDSTCEALIVRLAEE